MMRALVPLASMLALASGVLMPYSAPRRMSQPLSIKSSSWPEAPGREGKRAAFLHARADGVNIGECGVEIMTLRRDGLYGEPKEIKPRAILSGTLYVNPNFRRQGVAQSLLREAEHKARTWGMGEMLLMVKQHNANALKLYTKMGYVQLPQTKEHGNEVCMHKYLFAPTLHNLGDLLPRLPMVDI
jgi:GNAT superfamily N-acetyltransferase